MYQLALDLLPRREPTTCEFRRDVPSVGRVICMMDGSPVWTNCTEGVCGEPPCCVWEKPDNSPAAKSSRLRWIRGHKGLVDDGETNE